MTVTVALPFIILAVYVNPILRLVKVVLRPVRTATDYCRRAAPYLALVVKPAFKVLGVLIRNLDKVLWLLGTLIYGCLRILVLISLNWRRMYAWTKGLLKARKEAKANGRQWRNRHYFTRTMLRWSESPVTSKSKTDLEDQRTDNDDPGSESHHSSRMDNGPEPSGVREEGARRHTW